MLCAPHGLKVNESRVSLPISHRNVSTPLCLHSIASKLFGKVDSKSFVRATAQTLLTSSQLHTLKPLRKEYADVLGFEPLLSAGSMHCKDTSRYPEEPPENSENFTQVSPPLFLMAPDGFDLKLLFPFTLNHTYNSSVMFV